MLRISQAARGLQYGLQMKGDELIIVMAPDFAQESARRLVSIASNLRSGVTKLEDIELLGDFMPYRPDGAFGYGCCFKAMSAGRNREHWTLKLPSWKNDADTLDCVRRQMQAFLTLEAVFTVLNVQNETLASDRYPQRLEVDLNHDHRHGIATIKAELSLRATERLDFLTSHDESYVTETLLSMYRHVLPEDLAFDPSDIRFSVSDHSSLVVALPSTKMVSQRESAAQGLMLSTTETDTSVLQAFALLAALAALDEVLYGIVPPGL